MSYQDFVPLACAKTHQPHPLNMISGVIDHLQDEVVAKGIGEVLDVVFRINDGRVSVTIIGNVQEGSVKVGIFSESEMYIEEAVEVRINKWLRENRIGGERTIRSTTTPDGLMFILVVGKVEGS